MDLEKLEDKNYLQQVFNDKELLSKEIELTKGFILEKLKKINLTPSVDYFLDDLSLYNIQYVIENYKLEDQQRDKILSFLNYDSYSKNKLSPTLNPEEIIEYLKEEKLLPKKTILSLAVINEFSKEIIKQNEIDENNIETILKNSFYNFSIEDFLNTDKKFLKNNIYLMNQHKNYFSDTQYKSLYRELVTQNNDYDLRDFRFYRFKEEDKDFLIEILKKTSEYSRESYKELSNISGFSNLFTKYEFYEMFNPRNLKDFSDAEVENKKEFFQNIWLSQDFRHYEPFKEIVNKECSLHQFTTLVDNDFVFKMLSKTNTSHLIGYPDRDYGEGNTRHFHTASTILDVAVNDSRALNGNRLMDELSFYDIFKIIGDMRDSRHSSDYEKHPNFEKINQQNEDNITKIFNEFIPQFLNNKNIAALFSNSSYILSDTLVQHLIEPTQNSSSINLFYWMTQEYSKLMEKGHSRYRTTNMLEDYITQVHQNILNQNYDSNISPELYASNVRTSKLIIDLFNTKKLSLFKQLKSNYTLIDQAVIKLTKKSLVADENNFLAYEKLPLASIHEDLWAHIANARPDFMIQVLKSKETVPDKFLYHCLNNSSIEQYKCFLIGYVKEHRTEIEQSEIVSSFLSNEKQKEIFPVDSHLMDKKAYDNLWALFNQEKLVNNEYNEIEKTYDFNGSMGRSFYSRKDLKVAEINIEDFDETIPFDFQKAKPIEIKTRFVDLYQKAQFLRKKQEEEQHKISFEFFDSVVENLVKEKNFEKLNWLRDKRILSSHDDYFIDYVNQCEYKELKNNLSNPEFIAIFKDMISYENVTKIEFKKFTKDEQFDLVKLMRPIFGDDYSSAPKPFYFFNKNDRAFIKEFAIEHMPMKIFYGYDFHVEQGYKPTNFVTTPYSNEEIYRAYQNLEKSFGFFGYKDVNANFHHFLSDTFTINRKHPQTDAHKQENLDRFINFLDFIKDKDDKLYTLVAHSDSFQNSLNWGDKKEKKTRDEVINEFFVKTFDFDKLLSGMQMIVNDMKEKSHREDIEFSHKVASGALLSVIHNTYYDIQNVYHSHLSEENTLKLNKFLFQEAPEFFIERHVIGKALDPVVYFNDNYEKITTRQSIADFLYPDNRVHSEYFNLQHQQAERLNSYVKTIIEKSIENHDTPVIEYLSYMVKQCEFYQKEMNCDSRYNRKYGRDYSNTSVIEYISENQDIKNMLDKAKLKIQLDMNLEDKPKVVSKIKNKI